MFSVGRIGSIMGVATVPAFRRRGLGTALTWAAVREGAARGCTRATLAAQGASFDLYRKMGFVHVCNHRAYAPAGRVAYSRWFHGAVSTTRAGSFCHPKRCANSAGSSVSNPCPASTM